MKNLFFLCLLLCSFFARAQDQKITSLPAAERTPCTAVILTCSFSQQLDQQCYQHLTSKGKPGHGRTNKALEIVPVVVHIIHNNSPENITDAQAVQAIANIDVELLTSFG